ncbi:unnamed protein product [Amoebophrya sp. A25]|nr:unnamed protein product [Amoebophrya sp. A25]|eukprot:GSA25T00020995001.1
MEVLVHGGGARLSKSRPIQRSWLIYEKCMLVYALRSWSVSYLHRTERLRNVRCCTEGDHAAQKNVISLGDNSLLWSWVLPEIAETCLLYFANKKWVFLNQC